MAPKGRLWGKAVLVALVMTVAGGARLWAVRTAQRQPFQYAAAQEWKFEDYLMARIPDPQTGKPLTPTTKGLFFFNVRRILPDGTALVGARIVRLQSGVSANKLNPVPVNPPEKPDQLMLMTKEGVVYGPYAQGEDKKSLEAVASLNAWFERGRSRKPWVWHKVAPLEVGRSVKRQMGGESWTITRGTDDVVGGVLCDVYKARLDRGDIEVVETTWFYAAEGYVVKREIDEKRAKNVSSRLLQQRVL